MEFYQVINCRQTTRDLQEITIADDLLKRIIAAGL